MVVLTRGGSGSSGAFQQVSSGVDPTAALQIAAAERQADEQNRLSILGSVLGLYESQRDSAERLELTKESNRTALEIARLEGQNAQAAYAAQLQQATIAAASARQLAEINYKIAKKTKSRTNVDSILAAILGGYQIFSNQQSGGGGGWNFPTFPSVGVGGTAPTFPRLWEGF